MQTFLILLLIAAMVATLVALVRGVVSFLKNTEGGPSAASIRSNKMMQARILFQALAIVIVVLLLFLAGRT